MENITFTTEQKEQIKQNALAIEHYIVENVVPRLAGDVCLGFGGTHHDPRTGTPTPMYVLVIKPELSSFCKVNLERIIKDQGAANAFINNFEV